GAAVGLDRPAAVPGDHAAAGADRPVADERAADDRGRGVPITIPDGAALGVSALGPADGLVADEDGIGDPQHAILIGDATAARVGFVVGQDIVDDVQRAAGVQDGAPAAPAALPSPGPPAVGNGQAGDRDGEPPVDDVEHPE